RASSLLCEFATTISGIFTRGFFSATFFSAAALAREGDTRGASPSILRKCGGHGASPNPSASSLAANSSNASRAPAASSIPACGSPIAAKRAGIVNTVKSAGSHAATSSQFKGADTRPSGTGRTEYAEAVVLSFAFWLYSRNTPCRSSFHHFEVGISGTRRSTARESASAALRTSEKLQRG